MRFFRSHWSRDNVAGFLKRQMAFDTYDGRISLRGKAYIDRCTAAYEPDGVILILSRDVGHHTSGWWKNPDYERCIHLSLSYRDRVTGQPVERDKQNAKLWIDAVFGPTTNLIWAEPPYSPEGKKGDVWHYRVFYAEEWVAPILPRGEVYSKANTPAHWLSYSDVLQKEKDEVDTWLNQH